MEQRVRAVEAIFDVEFKDRKLLLQALTHRSFLNENPNHPTGHNERLEFVGDAVIEIVVTEMLYRAYPDAPEGELTNHRTALVNAKALGAIGIQLELDVYVLLSKGEQRDVWESEKRRVYTSACLFEAIIGALYLDQGMGECRMVLDHLVNTKRTELIRAYRDDLSALQDTVQARFGITPEYHVRSSSGLDHVKTFRMGCYLRAICIAEGEGTSKLEAKKAAAKKARETISQWEGRITEAGQRASEMRRSGKNGEAT